RYRCHSRRRPRDDRDHTPRRRRREETSLRRSWRETYNVGAARRQGKNAGVHWCSQDPCLRCVLRYAASPSANGRLQEAHMGIISFIKGGVAELAIARPDATKDYWVYKHPDQTIPMKAQLT